MPPPRDREQRTGRLASRQNHGLSHSSGKRLPGLQGLMDKAIHSKSLVRSRSSIRRLKKMRF